MLSLEPNLAKVLKCPWADLCQLRENEREIGKGKKSGRWAEKRSWSTKLEEKKVEVGKKMEFEYTISYDLDEYVRQKFTIK